MELEAMEIWRMWKKLFSNNELTKNKIYEHWATVVPWILSPPPGSPVHVNNNEEDVNYILLNPLDVFITDATFPNEVYTELEKKSEPPAFCGLVFRPGEPTYSCRDCGLDPTCVLCSKCFVNSKHKTHRYKISTSNGGGYCDCGDAEAWKQDPFCAIHDPALNKPENKMDEDSKEANFSLPQDLVDRARFVIETVLRYCIEVVSPKVLNDCDLPESLQMSEADLKTFCPKGTQTPYLAIGHCTVLYNDEVHSFDDVISALIASIKCTKKEATEFAQIIDKDGRAVIRCAVARKCNKAAEMIRQSSARPGAPLNLAIISRAVAAHQLFAVRLLFWLKVRLNQVPGFRQIFWDIVSQTPIDNDEQSMENNGTKKDSILETVILNDTTMWKNLRVSWHLLLMAGLMKEYETKRQFAFLFGRHFGALLQRHIDDDHDHSFSVTSLSVQLFTVPTIAQLLVQQLSLVTVIMKQILLVYSPLLSADTKKLDFSRRGTLGKKFKRANAGFMDLKYLLTSPPTADQWNEDLRTNFVQGFKYLIRFLTTMQHMDCMTREIGDHVEYEAEWQSGISLHMQIRPVIILMIEWAASDPEVLVKCYERALTAVGEHALLELPQPYIPRREHVELVGHFTSCLLYDVATRAVSVHLPISRIFASLYMQVARNRYENLASLSTPNVEEIVEPSLRTQVLAAQVHSGLWKRNGYSVLSQLYFYENVECGSDMLDKDIVSLQIGASLPGHGADKFLIVLLHRFGLFDLGWTENELKVNSAAGLIIGVDRSETERVVQIFADEFFACVLRVISARWSPGVAHVTKQECVQHEIIQQLCIRPLTHSALSKALVENVHYETGLEEVVQNVAGLKTVSGAPSTYHLKEEMYEEYDQFHYHYSREDQSEAELKQRERKRAKNEAELFPPPKLPRFTENFSGVVDILKSDVLMYLCHLVLDRCLKEKVKDYTEGQVARVLHLLGHGVREQVASPGFDFVEQACHWKIWECLESLSRSSSALQWHPMIQWLQSQRREIQPDVSQNTMDCISGSPEVVDTDADAEKRKRAAQARAKLLAQMNAAQKTFMDSHADLFKPDDKSVVIAMEIEEEEIPDEVIIGLGAHQSRRSHAPEIHICILCQEEHVLLEEKPFVLAAYVQRSSVLAQDKSKLVKHMEEKGGSKWLHERDAKVLTADLTTAPVVTCCGHVMHARCFEKHYDGVVQKEKRRPYRNRQPISFDVDRGEYLCPLCECLSNAVLPMSQSLPNEHTEGRASMDSLPLEEWINGVHKAISVEEKDDKEVHRLFQNILHHVRSKFSSQKSSHGDLSSSPGSSGSGRRNSMSELSSSPPLALSTHTGNDGRQYLHMYPRKYSTDSCSSKPVKDYFSDLVIEFSKQVLNKGVESDATLEDFRLPYMTWQAVAYTITSQEFYSRDQGTKFFGPEIPLRSLMAIRFLVRWAAVASAQIDKNFNIRNHLLELLTMVIDGKKTTPSLLDVDAFGILVGCTFSIAALFTTHDVKSASVAPWNDSYILQLMTLFHVTQILVSNDFSSCEVVDDMIPPDVTKTEELYLKIWALANKLPPSRLHPEAVETRVKEAMIPYLRNCAKFYENLNNIPAPEYVDASFDSLAIYLHLPSSLEELFGTSDFIHEYILKWVEHPDICEKRNVVVTYPRDASKILTPLAVSYADLLNFVADHRCPGTDSSQESASPTLCLVCGTLLCSRCLNCRVQVEYTVGGKRTMGACAHHAFYCGAGNGMFLIVRDCKLFFLASPHKGCFMSPPYLDSYGETDEGLHRGNPMSLCAERWEGLRRLWLAHSIPEEMARVIHHSSRLLTTDWVLL